MFGEFYSLLVDTKCFESSHKINVLFVQMIPRLYAPIKYLAVITLGSLHNVSIIRVHSNNKSETSCLQHKYRLVVGTLPFGYLFTFHITTWLLDV